jgi:hypothetical protein
MTLKGREDGDGWFGWRRLCCWLREEKKKEQKLGGRGG